MSIQIRTIRNHDLVALAPQLTGLHVQTGYTDHIGRLISGNIEGVSVLNNGPIANCSAT